MESECARGDRTELTFLRGGGEMGARMRARDWSGTPLGPPELWPQSLKTTIRILLDSRYAMWMGWGPEQIFFCNDAYLPTVGNKQPWVLGAPASQVWAEIWPEIGPRIHHVLTHGEATWDEGLLLFLERSGYSEETYHTFSYSPLYDDLGQVGGHLCVVTEETERVIGERRLGLLRELAAKLASIQTESEATTAIRKSLGPTSADLPFTLLYLMDPADGRARLACTTGLSDSGNPLAPEYLCDSNLWPVAGVLSRNQSEIVELNSRFGDVPNGPWDLPPQQALVVPLLQQGQRGLAGIFVAGLNPHRSLDTAYRGFIDLFAGQISAGLASARAYDEERRRAEALSELDRAKTAFFSNVSHEFRTPLTLMLGPLQDLLDDPANAGASKNRELLQIVRRNGQRLQKLVNTLLQFSRIEAGRVQAAFEPVDLASFTTELASVFRSAVEKAGLRLIVDCQSLSEPVFVDRDMWEKIVLNLISNAFKYTLHGEIEVSLKEEAGVAVLAVRDTGTGISAEELPRLFERFYRVEGAQGRTHEGTGIGLSLVRELVRLHGGSVRAESEVNKGSTFTVTIPLGKNHLPPDRLSDVHSLRKVSVEAPSFVEEALHWLPGSYLDSASAAPQSNGSPNLSTTTAESRATILLADDNRDMREYVQRLLSEQFHIIAAADGHDALQLCRRQLPDLVLTDVMMPGLDGFGLLKALRNDPATATLPVIMLSARAGEEARAEGLHAGADDYLVKPFSARELLSRINSSLTLSRFRLEASQRIEERFRQMADHAPVMMWVTEPDGSCTFLNKFWYEFTGQTPANGLGLGWTDAIHPDDRQRAKDAFLRENSLRQPFRLEYRLRHRSGSYHWALDIAAPHLSPTGEFLGYIGSIVDISDRKLVEGELRASEERYRQLINLLPMGVYSVDARGVIVLFNQKATLLWGRTPQPGETEESFCGALQLFRADGSRLSCQQTPVIQALRTGQSLRGQEVTIGRSDGTLISVELNVDPIRGGNGQLQGAIIAFQDVTVRKRAEEASRKQTQRLRLLWEAAGVLLTAEQPATMLKGLYNQIAGHFGLDAYFNFMVDETGEALRLSSCHGIPTETAQSIKRLEFGQAICGNVALRRSPIVATFIQNSDAPQTQLVKSLGIRAYACNPLMANGRLLGTLSFASRVRNQFDADELEFLRTVTNYVTVAFERARLLAELREGDRRKDEFLATLAHELRNPLAPIRNALEIMQLCGNDTGIIEDARQMMERQLQQMVRLVDDLLEVSRISRGKVELRKERVNLRDVLQSALETSRPLIDQAGLRLDISYGDESIFIDADVTRMAQVFANLLNNAAKYTPRGGHLQVGIQSREDRVEISIKDDGIGIPESMLGRIFDLFTQVDRSLEKSQGGLGIGLTIVKRLVEMHGGTVTARSAGTDAGSEFVVSLPVIPALNPATVSQELFGRNGSRQRRILVVDDNQDAATTMSMMLRLLGHELRTVHDGSAAIEEAERFHPEVMFLDIGLPKLNGYDVARHIRSQAWGRPLYLVALTGWGQQDDKRKAAEAGFDHHFTKPVDPTALQKLLLNLPD